MADVERRKFARAIRAPGSAAAIREAVVKDLRESSVLSKPKLIEPLDYENIIVKNKTLLHNDPQREMLLFPHDDVSQSELPRRFRSVNCSVPPNALSEAEQLLPRESIKSYTNKWNVIHFKYNAYSSGFQQLPKCGRNVDLPQQVFEIDLETEGKDEDSVSRSRHIKIVRQGWLYKGPDSSNEASIVSFTRSFKRRYFYLKQQTDASYVLEYHKDDKRAEQKGNLFLDLAFDVSKSSRKGKLAFEIQMQDKGFHVFAAESEIDLDEWVTTLKKIIQSNNDNSNDKLKDKESDSLSNRESFRGSMEQSTNPELQKYAGETDNALSQQRREGRRKIFLLYPDVKKQIGVIDEDKDEDLEHECDAYREQFGTRILVQCNDFRLRLQANLADDGLPEQLDNPEPFFLTFALYDAKEQKKISEDFSYNPNSFEISQMLMTSNEHKTMTSGMNLSSEFSAFLPDPKWLEQQKTAIFSVTKPDVDVFLVVRIEKILQGSVSAALDQYLRTTDIKAGTKLHKTMKQYCQRLGHYRMPFAWAARPMFRKYSMEVDTTADFVVYKAESSRMCEEEIIKQLQDMRRTDKQMRLQPIQGVVLKVNVTPFKAAESTRLTPCTLTSTLLAVRPFEETTKNSPTREVEELMRHDGPSAYPHTTYINHLYVHPKNLKFDTQKIFAKARNIACCIEVRDSDEDGAFPLKIIYSPLGSSSLFVASSTTSVLHHNTSPDFMDEVKISLPTCLHDKHHLVFTFYHIACDLTTKPTSKKSQSVESVVGYAYFPLLVQGRLNVGEHSIRVATHQLPSGYLSFEQLGLGKGSIGPDMKWMDGGRPLFKFELILMSTIYTKDPHLHNFFNHCQKLESLPSAATDVDTTNKLKSSSSSVSSGGGEVGSGGGRVAIRNSVSIDGKTKEEMVNVVKSLHAVDIGAIINFLPALLTQLLRLLTRTNSEEVAMNAVRVLVHVISTVNDADKKSLLQSYVKYVFVTESVTGPKQRTVHEELAQYLNSTLRPNMADQLVVGKFLKHSWFFFKVLIKSMAQHLLSTDRIKMSRNERFPSSFQYHIESLVRSLCQHIVQKYKESSKETRSANTSLANFIKKCFTFMDRGFVFRLVNIYIENISPCDVKVIHEYKFEFLRIICNHEHFIPLNLPLMRKQVKSFKDVKQDYTLSEEFQKNHFLVGLLLYEVKSALNEIQDVRKCAITVVRNLLAKHSFDDRYMSKPSQSRIAALYLPLISILLENKSRLLLKENVQISPNNNNNVTNGGESQDVVPNRMGSMDSYSSQVSLDQTSVHSSISSASQPRPKCDPNVFSLISGQVGANTHSLLENNQRQSHYGSQTSLASTVSANSTSTMDRIPAVDAIGQKEKCDSMASIPCSSFSPSTVVSVVARYDKLNRNEIKDLLICFLYVVKNLAEEIILGWFNNSPEYDILDFLSILEICMQQFQYAGKKRITSLCIISGSRRSVTFGGVRKQPQLHSNRGASAYSEIPHSNSDNANQQSISSEADGASQALMEANLCVETGMIVLDTISLYVNTFREQLQYQDGENAIMHKIFDLYLMFPQQNQSEIVQKHAFAELRSFISKFPKVLFQGQANMCGRLCYEILRSCSSRLDSTRTEACALIYLLMKKNFEVSSNKSFNRVHLQIIISVAQLISNGDIISNTRFTESLCIISSYASNEKALQRTSFSVEVKDLTKCVRTVLMATAAMKEHKNNPEMLIDLHYSLAKSYTSTPELRKTWLETMAQIHVKNGDFSEAAHCYIHIAALVAEYLKRRGEFPQGCTVFKAISPNVESEETGMRDDSGMQDVAYREDHLTDLLEKCAYSLQKAERYELLGEIYRFILPIYEQKRDFEHLSSAYAILHEAYSKIVDVMKTGKRLLGKYFRVAFFGQSYFEDENGKEYVYKEPKITGLTEICDRLQKLYSEKFGQNNVKLIMDSNKVNPQDLDQKFAYIQITYVTPYFDEKELEERQTQFERSNNIRRFMFETPFTKEGKAHGLIEEQHKRRTILTTSHSFPYVKKRIEVLYHKEETLSPIEVAIDEMKNKILELSEVVEQQVPDIKKLQLKLQGSVSVQVNAGPIAYAEAFLTEGKIQKYKRDKVGALKEYFRNFVMVCREALELNSQLISNDQREYHHSLQKNFNEMAERLGVIFGETLVDEDDRVSLASNRNSTILQGSIATSGSIMTF